MAIIRINQELNGIEICFENKPEQATITALKNNGFRWSPKNKLWYAKQTAERVQFAESLGDVTASAPASSKEVYNLENLGSRKIESFWGADLAKVIREELKNRGVKGCTVRGGKATYTPTITVTIKATAADLASLEEAEERYNFSQFSFDIQNHDKYIGDRWLYSNEFNNMSDDEKEAVYYKFLEYSIKKTDSFERYHHERKKCFTLTTAFYNKCLAAFKIANQFNWDHSDSMTDYFDIGYFLDIDIKHDAEIELRATMTEDERTSYAAEIAQKEAEEATALEQFRKKQEEAKKAAEAHNKYVKESEELIYNDIVLEDLEEAEQLYINNLVGGSGKECNLNELKESLTDSTHTAVISRRVIFHNEEAFNRFNDLYLYDFMFLAGKGGTGAEDARLDESINFYQLNEKQKATIKFFMCDCVAVYLDNDLKLVIDPQGHNYSRYVYLTTENTEIKAASPILAEFRKESEEEEPFYFPAPVEEQANNITVGEPVTIYQCDSWILNNIYAGSGIVKAVRPGDYAQYKGVYIDLETGKKQKSVFIRNNHDCLIYKGIKDRLPDTITRKQINANMYELFNYDVLIPNIYSYYKELGETPIIDTYQR